jgi:hypothetical protein
MARFARITGLALGLAFTWAVPAIAPAQQYRNMPFAAGPAAPLQNNFNQNYFPTGGGVGPTTNPFASVPYGAFNTGYYNQQYGNPFLSGSTSPYANPYFTGGYSANTASSSPVPQGTQRATSALANPMNFWQYGQITGTGPTRGTVQTYNVFGLLGMQNNPYLGSTLSSNSNQNNDSPPPGVNLSVNYAQMFLPNQAQVNGTGYNPYASYWNQNPYSPFSYYGNLNPYGANPYAYPGYFGGMGMGSPPATKGFFGNGGDGL